jgi:replicative DNA helicase
MSTDVVVTMDQRRPPAGRVPPHNLAAEESLLGAMLLNRDAIGAAVEYVQPEDYYKPAHGHIHAAIVTLWQRGDPSDAVTIADELRRTGLIDSIGGRSTLVSLQAATPASSNAASYAKTVAGYATLRRLISVAGEIAELGYSAPTDILGAVDRAESLLFEVGDSQLGDDTTRLSDVYYRTLETIERRVDGTEPPGLTIGLTDVDTLTGGLSPGSLVTIAARPAMGKSHLAAYIAAHIARQQQIPSLLVSAEMSRDQMGERFLALSSGVDMGVLRTGRLAEPDWPKITAATGRDADLPVFISADGSATIASIRAKARRLTTRLHATPVLIIDYIQLLHGAEKAENRQNEIATLSRGLKQLALDLRTVVFSLAQVNRGVETRADKRPMLADLRESGAIEADSDVVMFLYRDDMYNDDTPDRGTVEVHVAKNRQGRTGTRKIGYNPATGRYWNLATGTGDW